MRPKGVERVEIRATYHHEESTWWAESDDLPGFSAANESLGEVRRMLLEAVPEFVSDAEVSVREHLDDGALLVPLGATINAHGVVVDRLATYTSSGPGAVETVKKALNIRAPNSVLTTA